MTATAAQIAQVRRMVHEPTEDMYTDEDIADYIESYPAIDELGSLPYTWDTSTSPPTQDENEDWIPTYDLNAAAADIWGEKAAAITGDFDFSADGGTYNRSQVVAQYQQRERFYRARRKPGTIHLVMSPSPDDSEEPGWVVNVS